MPIRHRTKIIAAVAGALAVVLSLVTATGDHGWVHRLGVALLGPPAVAMAEAYEEPPPDTTIVFDHSIFNDLLQKHVDVDGWVDYKALLENADALNSYIASLANAPFDDLGRNEKLALLINAYNAFTLRLILDHYPVKSIKDIPDADRWDAVRWRLAGGTTGGASGGTTGGGLLGARGLTALARSSTS